MTQALDGARRRQFLLGPAADADLPGSQPTTIPGVGLLQAGLDLGVAQARAGELTVTVVGFILDPTDPARGDADIARELAATPSLEGLPLATARFGGRWAVIASRGGARVAFTDPAGLRQLHYAVDGSGRVWCASQAPLLARRLGLPADPDAEAFGRSLYFRSYAEPFWPVDTTRFAGVRRLLPNHALDLATGRVTRFWPARPPSRDSVGDPVPAVAELLRGTIRAASLRWPLALALSSGWDSRTLLAASRDVAGQLLCFTIDNRVGGANAADVRVARRLTGRLGVSHVVVNGSTEEPRSLVALQESVDPAHRYCARHAGGLLRDLPADRLALTGNLSELGRSYFQTHYPGLPHTARGFAGILNMERDPWAVAAIGHWVDDAVPAATRHGYDPVDLFHLEAYCGAWLSSGQAEWDLAMDTLAPFNSRLLIETVLAIEPSARILPANAFHRALMSTLWPEVLSEPFNPDPLRARAAGAVKRAGTAVLRRAGVYERVKGAYLEARSRRIARP